jgi:PhzF family phenazine biosynthesis protein
LCRLLGLNRDDLASSALWCDTGSEQLLLPVHSIEAVQRARPDAAFADAWPANGRGRKNVFLFAMSKDTDGGDAIRARYFFKSATGVGEDPGTGSACINLGAWHHMQVMPIAWQATVTQGVEIGRPCRILLDVSKEGDIRIGGSVVELGGGTINL